MRPCVRRTRGSAREGVPSSDAARGKIGENGRRSDAGNGATRAEKKAGKNYFGGSEGAGEKKNIFWAGAKKISGVNENTTHKRLTYRREDFF